MRKYLNIFLCVALAAVATFAQASFTDNFTRANEDPLNATNYSQTVFGTNGDLSVVSNVCEVGATTNFNIGAMYYSGAVLPNDQFATMKVTAAANGSFLLEVRSQDTQGFSGNGYILNVNLAFQSYTVQVNSGGSAIISGGYSALNVGDVIGLQAAGTQICATRNGSAVGCATDATWGSGTVALGLLVNSARNDTTTSQFQVGHASPLTPPSSGSVQRHRGGIY